MTHLTLWFKRCSCCGLPQTALIHAYAGGHRFTSRISEVVSCALYVALVMVVIAIAVLIVAPRVGAAPATIPYIYHLDRPAVDLPEAMAQDAAHVFLGCEVHTAAMTPYGKPWNARNPSGAWGTAQLMPIHAPGMARLGLDYNDDGDRIKYAVMLWSTQGWNPWSCKP